MLKKIVPPNYEKPYKWVTHINEAECDLWIKKGDDYFLYRDKKEDRLPIVQAERFENVLIKNNISYNIVVANTRKKEITECEYYDKEHYELVEEELPVYEFDDKTHKYFLRGTYKGMVPSKETVKYANSIKVVAEEVERINNNLAYADIVKRLNGDPARYFFITALGGGIKEGKVRNFNVYSLKLLGNMSTRNHIFVFDLDQCKDKEFTLVIPKKYSYYILNDNEEWLEKIADEIESKNIFMEVVDVDPELFV